MIYTKQEWYTPAEVAVHNRPSDCWVSLNGKVYDLTSWVEEQRRLCKCIKVCSCRTQNWYCDDLCVEYCRCFKGEHTYCAAKKLAMTVLAFAGKDVSHWFNGDEWAKFVHPVTMLVTPYQPHGFGMRQPPEPATRWRPLHQPWWMNERCVVGKATVRARPIRIINTLAGPNWSPDNTCRIENRYPSVYDPSISLTRGSSCNTAFKTEWFHPGNGTTTTLEVCSEETIYQIMMRYLPHNSHMHSYTWRYLGQPLDYSRTLEENGIPDERDRFSEVALPENVHIPAILIYFDDDLTEDPPKDNCFCQDRACVKCKPVHMPLTI